MLKKDYEKIQIDFMLLKKKLLNKKEKFLV